MYSGGRMRKEGSPSTSSVASLSSAAYVARGTGGCAVPRSDRRLETHDAQMELCMYAQDGMRRCACDSTVHGRALLRTCDAMRCGMRQMQIKKNKKK